MFPDPNIDPKKSNSSTVLFLLAVLNRSWVTVDNATTVSPYASPNGWTFDEIPGGFFKNHEELQDVLDEIATYGCIDGKTLVSTLNPDGTRGPGSMLDTLAAAWSVHQRMGTRVNNVSGDPTYDPASTECLTATQYVTQLTYAKPPLGPFTPAEEPAATTGDESPKPGA